MRRSARSAVEAPAPGWTLVLALAAFLLAATPAAANDPATIAALAQSIHGQHCANASADARKLAAKSFNEVSAHWMRVIAAVEAGGPSYLLYWQGMLEMCLQQPERATESLNSFLDAAAEISALAGMRTDARRRLKLLRRSLSTSPEAASGPAPLIATMGIGLGVGSGLFGGLAGWQWQQALDVGDEINSSRHPSTQLDELVRDGDSYAQTNGVFIAISTGLGVGSFATFLVAAASSPRSRPTTVFYVVPTDGGLALGAMGSF